MELAFGFESLRTICEKEAEARRELEVSVAETLKHRLADLRAAGSVNDLIAGRPRLLSSPGNNQMVLDLPDRYHMIFSANHPNNPVSSDGTTDWANVRRIKILRIDSDSVD